MISARTLALTAFLACGATTHALAQAAAPVWPAPPPPPGQAPAPQAVPQAVPQGAPPQAQMGPPPGQQMPPCFKDFLPLRQDAEKKAAVLKASGPKKLTQPEACAAFKAFSAAEEKVVQYVEKNGTWCGIPADAVKQMKANHGKTVKIKDQICNGARPAGPAAPSLSDALGGGVRIPDASTTRTGQGTLDTLTGNPLAR